MQTDILIVGAGLCGLSLAARLQNQGRDILLVEARDRVGGRIKSITVEDAEFDLGPTWFWEDQPRIAQLSHSLGIQKFDQFSGGHGTYEDDRGKIQRGEGFATMQGSYRLSGGIAALTDALAQQIASDRLRLNTQIESLVDKTTHIVATITGGSKITANTVVLALPPRIAAEMSFTPKLDMAAIHAMQATATWMAGHAKAVAIYDTPFWRAAGMSGDAVSRRGPLAEIHDASPNSHGPFALFGFLGVSPGERSDVLALEDAIVAQLQHLFGPAAGSPKAIYIQDWATEAFTATKADHTPLQAHPTYGQAGSLHSIWQNRLILSGTEMAQRFGGFLEGALEAADETYVKLLHLQHSAPKSPQRGINL